ncbi:MAG: P-loop NTPase fold protein, partial [Opitutales bacterium]
MKDNYLPSLLDREVRASQDDAFGHRDLADALRSLIESTDHKPPYSIGLLGSWGSGKSSIKELYLCSLNGEERDLESDSNGRTRTKKIKSITFNAWRFGGENIKRALIRHVFVSIGGKSDEIMDRLFRRFEHSIKEPKGLKRICQDLLDHWFGQAIQLIILFFGILGFIGVVFGIGKLFGIENNWMLSVVSAAGLAALGTIAKELFAQNRLLMPIFNEGLRVDEPVSGAEQYEQLLLEQLEKFKRSKEGKHCERIVVFLDDLDRLSSEEMVAGLDAVRTFLEIDAENLPQGLGLIFVISCDEGLVADALAKRSKRNGDIPGTISDAASARRYLDRIFQFRLDVPDIPKQDMRTFVVKRMNEDLPSLVKDLHERSIDLEAVVNRLVHYDVSSPRNAIQLVNAFSQSWWLACRREREGAGSKRAGGLSKGAVTEHPISLAAVCGLRVNFPEFYQDLLSNTEFIDRFTYTFCRTEPVDPKTIPDSVRPQLSKYANSDWELDSKHRPLRSYLSSLQGLRWPVGGLLPLLQLSQDPISREFGPRERSLYNAIRNGDTPGLLEALDLTLTDRPLHPNDIHKVSDIYGQLERNGSQIEQENALSCFAGVSNRLPKFEARRLLTPLARKIRDSANLRWRVGLNRIEQFLPSLDVQERKDVAAVLIQDILNTEGSVKFHT